MTGAHVKTFVIVFYLYWVGLSGFVFYDMNRRGRPGWKYVVVLLVVTIIGMAYWIIGRARFPVQRDARNL